MTCCTQGREQVNVQARPAQLLCDGFGSDEHAPGVDYSLTTGASVEQSGRSIGGAAAIQGSSTYGRASS